MEEDVQYLAYLVNVSAVPGLRDKRDYPIAAIEKGPWRTNCSSSLIVEKYQISSWKILRNIHEDFQLD